MRQCIVRLTRNSFRYAGRQHRDGIVKVLKPVYTAPSEAAAKDRFAEFVKQWGQAVSGDRTAEGELLGFNPCPS